MIEVLKLLGRVKVAGVPTVTVAIINQIRVDDPELSFLGDEDYLRVNTDWKSQMVQSSRAGLKDAPKFILIELFPLLTPGCYLILQSDFRVFV